ncbi:MAG: TIR domain-containing protein [Clostridia bacterium]|nr:TIR domain-containing protein [Clostridia bacterium]
MPTYKGNEKYIFVSYAHKDSEKVLPVIEDMQRAGFRVWYDTGIEAGTEWPAYIEESLEKSAVVLAFISTASIESVNCRNEINYALLKHKEMLVIYLEDIVLKYGLGLQLNALQSLYHFRHTSEKSFMNELLKAPILQECKKNVVSFEEMRRMNAKNGKRRAVMKTVVLTPGKQQAPAVAEQAVNDQAVITEQSAKAQTVEEPMVTEQAVDEQIIEDTVISETERKYNEAVSLMSVSQYESALTLFESLGGYRDSYEKTAQCTLAIPEDKYNRAVSLMTACKYEDAIAVFESLDGYKDSYEKIAQSKTAILDGKYHKAVSLMNAERYEEAIAAFESFDGYRESYEKIVQCNTAILDGKYNKAVALMNAKKYAEALSLLETLDGYKDSVEKAREMKFLLGKAEFLEQCKTKGNIVSFGAYEQNFPGSKEAIEWEVLEVRYGRAFLISKYALDYKPFNTKGRDGTWETCTLRAWLNEDFLNAAFSESEKAVIPTVTVPNHGISGYYTDSSDATQDKIFLASDDEVSKFLDRDSKRCVPTAFAVMNRGNSGQSCTWWLREINNYSHFKSYVDEKGSTLSNATSGENHAVRPVLWIDLNA